MGSSILKHNSTDTKQGGFLHFSEDKDSSCCIFLTSINEPLVSMSLNSNWETQIITLCPENKSQDLEKHLGVFVCELSNFGSILPIALHVYITLYLPYYCKHLISWIIFFVFTFPIMRFPMLYALHMVSDSLNHCLERQASVFQNKRVWRILLEKEKSSSLDVC